MPAPTSSTGLHFLLLIFLSSTLAAELGKIELICPQTSLSKIGHQLKSVVQTRSRMVLQIWPETGIQTLSLRDITQAGNCIRFDRIHGPSRKDMASQHQEEKHPRVGLPGCPNVRGSDAVVTKSCQLRSDGGNLELVLNHKHIKPAAKFEDYFQNNGMCGISHEATRCKGLSDDSSAQIPIRIYYSFPHNASQAEFGGTWRAVIFNKNKVITRTCNVNFDAHLDSQENSKINALTDWERYKTTFVKETSINKGCTEVNQLNNGKQ